MLGNCFYAVEEGCLNQSGIYWGVNTRKPKEETDPHQKQFTTSQAHFIQGNKPAIRTYVATTHNTLRQDLNQARQQNSSSTGPTVEQQDNTNLPVDINQESVNYEVHLKCLGNTTNQGLSQPVSVWCAEPQAGPGRIAIRLPGCIVIRLRCKVPVHQFGQHQILLSTSSIKILASF